MAAVLNMFSIKMVQVLRDILKQWDSTTRNMASHIYIYVILCQPNYIYILYIYIISIIYIYIYVKPQCYDACIHEASELAFRRQTYYLVAIQAMWCLDPAW